MVFRDFATLAILSATLDGTFDCDKFEHVKIGFVKFECKKYELIFL